MPSPSSRRVLPILLTALALPSAGVITMLASAGTAWAQSIPLFDGGLLELVPPTGLVGDGASTADLYVLALTNTGAPITGLKGKPTASAGTTTDLVEQGGGLYKFSYTPAKASARQDVSITLKAKTTTKEQLSKVWTVSVAAPVSHPVSAVANPALLTLGQDKTASLSITLAGADSVAAANADMKVSSTAGAISNLTNLGNGQFSALFTAPTEPYPRMALITVADRHDPSRSYGGVALPLVGKADFPVSVAPNAKVILKVAGREFGPVQADANGKARIPIIVPPGVSGATIVTIGADGKSTESPLDLKIPESRRVALFPTTPSVPGDASVPVTVRAMVVTPDGKPDGNAAVVFAASAGSMSAAKHEGGGIYAATYTPPNSLFEGTTSISVSLTGGSKDQSDKADVKLLAQRPTKVDLLADPATLPAGGDTLTVKASLVGNGGSSLTGRSVTFSADGAKLKEVKDLKNGSYTATFTTTGSGPVDIAALSSVPGSQNPLARVLLVPQRETVSNDGLSAVPFLVVTVDEYGYPVGNQGVSLRVVAGDGNAPGTVTTGTDGTATVYYTAGRKNGLVALEAAAGGTTANAALLQVQPGVTIPVLPASGPKSIVDQANAWRGSLGRVHVDRAGATGMATPPVVSGTATAAAPVGGGVTPTKIAVASEPAMVAPGTSSTLRITLTDASGKGVAGQALDFLSSAGTITNVKELGNGVYSATLAVPAGSSGEVKVSAATRDGAVSSFVRIPVGVPVATVPLVAPSTPESAWGVATEPETKTTAPTTTPATTTPVAPSTAPSMTPATPTTAPTMTPTTTTPTATTSPKREPMPAGDQDRPFFRARVGFTFGSYGYDQAPLAQGGTLYPKSITFPAGTTGVTLNARYFQPNFRYLGLEGALRVTSYAVDPTPLCAGLGKPCDGTASVADGLVDLHLLGVARYAFDTKNSMFWAGARIGYGYGDVQGISATDTTIDFPQFKVNALGLGAELGGEIGDRLLVQAGFTEYLAGGGSPYDTTFGLELAYSLTDLVYLSGAYDLSARKVSVLDNDNNKVGEISDTLNVGTISLGISL